MNNAFYSHIVFEKTDKEIDAVLDRLQKAQAELRECYYELEHMGFILKADPAPSKEND